MLILLVDSMKANDVKQNFTSFSAKYKVFTSFFTFDAHLYYLKNITKLGKVYTCCSDTTNVLFRHKIFFSECLLCLGVLRVLCCSMCLFFYGPFCRDALKLALQFIKVCVLLINGCYHRVYLKKFDGKILTILCVLIYIIMMRCSNKSCGLFIIT